MASLGDLTVNVRITVDGRSVPSWRVRMLGRVARLLGVPVSFERTDDPTKMAKGAQS